MSILLWVLGYLLVGFVAAVVVERYWPNRPIAGPPILFSQTFWPFVLGVIAMAYICDRLERLGNPYEDFIRWCARKLP